MLGELAWPDLLLLLRNKHKEEEDKSKITDFKFGAVLFCSVPFDSHFITNFRELAKLQPAPSLDGSDTTAPGLGEGKDRAVLLLSFPFVHISEEHV